MTNPALDQTTLEESFFFCEYAKRRFEVSSYNNGEIEKAIDTVGLILDSYYKETYNVPYPMKMDFLSDVIIACEYIGVNELAKKFRCHRVETRKLSFKNLAEQANQAINELENIGNLLDIACRFNMSSSFLPFPYNMESVILNIVSNKGLPQAFKLRDIEEQKCFVMGCNNYILFLVNRHVSLDETIQELTRQATLFKSNDDYKKSGKPEILSAIHKKSKSGTHKQTQYNTYYKSIGIFLYDLCIINKYNYEGAADELMRMHTKIKCSPKFKILESSKDCNFCKKFGACRSLWKKQFFAAVDKIKGTESQEEWLKIAKEKSQQKICERRPVSFFEYKFGTPPTPSEK
ncbi:hypothetical protein SAMN02910291_01234 [Desulfovibrio desulfuricans]|uniref:Uncharacterized protein n=2 Tax=Desulfovibrio TaxID=872 RepID=A0AA94L265_DESDE|nr:hypothetical protein [Desulfovibrio desulfuricans]ATD82477.1 hypothetical protein CNY67_14640 [Desulfovibrio sp. G11]SFW42147.1 hypothetical protein SAMN02910291_01234 [Desulfovibrio desulfuricans]SPD35270.1 Hypothetical protein DSVG11_1166 [Desulfovibrio sp. G11]